ncbi:uncharacterized protein A4U43_C04F2080 [Asparagus officinalis]|uniref:ATP-dependent RNA helicase n=1 Tax=Asparagus officinalis TaxID=4686 RepID=A0A5P1F2A8_ASPOF|nr:DEAD-box ATP-dependent RNA helicase 13 [Asparagus officinalis]ONK70841.1 uncharacterized protein A4U43_C04F2080 [Asparagus officinalis]
MAESSSSKQNQRKKATKPKKTRELSAPDPARLSSLSWNESFAGDDDAFALLAGGDEGGFLTLEEIDEADYGFIGGVSGLDPKGSVDSKKRKKGSGDLDDPRVDRAEEDDAKKKKKKKSRRERKKNKEKKKNGGSTEIDDEEQCPALVPILADEPARNDIEDDAEDGMLLNDDDVYAWKELRLHSLLIKSMRRLGFREPTPIQKACIPAAAHQGKDVIGAAETGSGKTLAFGLPILQRLLDEREKATRSLQNGENSAEIFKGGPLRALIITPTRELALQVCDHLKAASRNIDIQVVPIVGGMSSEKQERLLKRRPEIIVGTPGRLWDLISGGNQHLVELHSLSFFILDEADRMIANGHFRELQSIIDMLPMSGNSAEHSSQTNHTCTTVPNLQRKKRQTFVFSATLALSDNFRKKLKRSSSASKPANTEGISSIETLSERAGIRSDVAIVDLTNATIMADKLEESFIECSEEDKEAYLYYILSVHGQGRTIVFCTSIAILRRISNLLLTLGMKAWTLHSQRQQKARLKAIDNFRANENGVLIATDVAARGLDIPGVRTVVHYQLPHSADVYIHRSGRTARASADGCSIALISPSDKTKFVSLCKSMSKESFQRFPLDDSYLPGLMKRLSLARQIDEHKRKTKQENSKKSWLERNAESLELTVEDSGSEEDTVHAHKQKKISSLHLKRLEQALNDLLAQPLQPKTFSRRYFAGAGISLLHQKQFEEISKMKTAEKLQSKDKRRAKFVVIGQNSVEPLEALRCSGQEVSFNPDRARENRKTAVDLKRKRREEKKRARDQRKNEKKRRKGESA